MFKAIPLKQFFPSKISAEPRKKEKMQIPSGPTYAVQDY